MQSGSVPPTGQLLPVVAEVTVLARMWLPVSGLATVTVEGGLTYRTTSRIDAAHVALGKAIAEWKGSLGHPQLDEYSEFADRS